MNADHCLWRKYWWWANGPAIHQAAQLNYAYAQPDMLVFRNRHSRHWGNDLENTRVMERGRHWAEHRALYSEFWVWPYSKEVGKTINHSCTARSFLKHLNRPHEKTWCWPTLHMYSLNGLQVTFSYTPSIISLRLLQTEDTNSLTKTKCPDFWFSASKDSHQETQHTPISKEKKVQWFASSFQSGGPLLSHVDRGNSASFIVPHYSGLQSSMPDQSSGPCTPRGLKACRGPTAFTIIIP